MTNCDHNIGLTLVCDERIVLSISTRDKFLSEKRDYFKRILDHNPESTVAKNMIALPDDAFLLAHINPFIYCPKCGKRLIK